MRWRPARSSAWLKRLRIFEASKTLPVSGCAKTKALSPVRNDCWKCSSSPRARASAIGTHRPRWDFGESKRPRKALRDADARGRPVDVGPAQSDQLALAQPRHRRTQIERALDAPEQVVGHG